MMKNSHSITTKVLTMKDFASLPARILHGHGQKLPKIRSYKNEGICSVITAALEISQQVELTTEATATKVNYTMYIYLSENKF